jgi:hypothetical protein
MTKESKIEWLVHDYLTEFYKTATYIQLIANSMSNVANNPKELMERIKMMQKHTGALYGITNAIYFSVLEQMDGTNE